VITAKFNTGIGTGVDATSFSLTPSTADGQTTITWKVDASGVTNDTAKTTLSKNSVG
jgi:hypothetical protein